MWSVTSAGHIYLLRFDNGFEIDTVLPRFIDQTRDLNGHAMRECPPLGSRPLWLLPPQL
jgi:hypothetical protein